MENAAEALKMAGAVLLFLIAISVSIISFGNVREAADTILEYKDRETTYIDGEYYYSQSTENEREVGLETILPTLSRVYTENYKVVFEGLTDPIYTVKKSGEARYCLDAEFDNDIRGSGTTKEKSFLSAVIYGDKDNAFNSYKDKVTLPSVSLYYRLQNILSSGSNKKIVEKSGVYYQDDEKNPNIEDDGSTEDESNIGDEPEVNKTKKRIITYVITNK